jgi:hypothetical protein
MRIALFSAIILLFLIIWPKNEAQRQAWNRFWAIRDDTSQGENQVQEEKTQQRYTVIQGPLSNNNFNHTSLDNLQLYRLQQKARLGQFGETQFEFLPRH